MKTTTTFTITEIPSGLKELRVGDRFDWYERPPWYVRAWRWIRRAVLRRGDPPPPPPCTITHIDYEKRIVTYGAPRPQPPLVPGTRFCGCSLALNGRSGAWHPDYPIPDRCSVCGKVPA